MTLEQYIENHAPQDFIKIDNEIFVLPIGYIISVSIKEIGGTLTTADGTVRKDTIAKKTQVSLKYKIVLQEGFNTLFQIVNIIETSAYETEKTLFLKKENTKKNITNIYDDFTTVNIDIIELDKYAHAFRRRGLFVYEDITLKIN